MSYAVHGNETFFLDVCEDSLSMVHLFIIINENFTEYSSNVTLLCSNYINKYILTVSLKKLSKICFFFYRINLTPPPSPQPKKMSTIEYLHSSGTFATVLLKIRSAKPLSRKHF